MVPNKNYSLKKWLLSLSAVHFPLLSGSLISAKLKLPYQSSLGNIDIPQSALHVSMRREKSGSVRLTENVHPGDPSPAPPPRILGVTASMIPSRVRWVHSLFLISSLKVILFVVLFLPPSPVLTSLSPPTAPAQSRLLDWMISGKQRLRSDRLTALISSTDA